MNFAKVAADVVTDRTACLLLAKEAQAIVVDPDQVIQDENAADEARKSKRNRLLWALGGLAALGGAGYLAHRSGALNDLGSMFRSKSPDTQPGVLQRTAEGISEAPVALSKAVGLGGVDPSGVAAPLALGALNASRGSQRLSQFLPTGNRWMRRALPGNPADSLHGTLGMADQLRESAQRSPGAASTPGFLDSVSGRGERDALRDRMHNIFSGMKDANRARLAEQLEKIFDAPGKAGPSGLQEVLYRQMNPKAKAVSPKSDVYGTQLEKQVASSTPYGGRLARLLMNRRVDTVALEQLDRGLTRDIEAARRAVAAAAAKTPANPADAAALERLKRVVQSDMGIDLTAKPARTPGARAPKPVPIDMHAEQLRDAVRQFRTLKQRPGRSFMGVLRRGALPIALTHGAAPAAASLLRWSGLDAPPEPKEPVKPAEPAK